MATRQQEAEAEAEARTRLISLRLTSAERADLDRLAAERDQSISDVVRTLLADAAGQEVPA